METLEHKNENIKKQFLNTMLEGEWTQEELTGLISAFSYYISKTNINYKYNQTYLISYCEEFCELKNYLRARVDVVEQIQELFRKLEDSIGGKYTVVINGLWEIIYEQEKKNKIWNVTKHFSGNIDKNKLFNDKLLIAIKVFARNNHVAYYEFLTKEFNLTDNEKLEKEIIQIINQMKKMELKYDG